MLNEILQRRRNFTRNSRLSWGRCKKTYISKKCTIFHFSHKYIFSFLAIHKDVNNHPKGMHLTLTHLWFDGPKEVALPCEFQNWFSHAFSHTGCSAFPHRLFCTDKHWWTPLCHAQRTSHYSQIEVKVKVYISKKINAVYNLFRCLLAWAKKKTIFRFFFVDCRAVLGWLGEPKKQVSNL